MTVTYFSSLKRHGGHIIKKPLDQPSNYLLSVYSNEMTQFCWLHFTFASFLRWWSDLMTSYLTMQKNMVQNNDSSIRIYQTLDQCEFTQAVQTRAWQTTQKCFIHSKLAAKSIGTLKSKRNHRTARHRVYRLVSKRFTDSVITPDWCFVLIVGYIESHRICSAVCKRMSIF